MELHANFIWVFHGERGRYTGGVFTCIENAEAWIGRHGLTGVLTAYPLDEGCFDWAVREGKTGMKDETFEKKKHDPVFMGSFSSACQDHFHYEARQRA